MSRLILIPQYPAYLRYQEWWFDLFRTEYSKLFDSVVVLGEQMAKNREEDPWYGIKEFAPLEKAINFETEQIREYINLEIDEENDTLLLNDLSFPGLFPHILFHKRPRNCFAITHATSLNKYDYFAKDRPMKYPIETKVSKLFNKVFVATNYHADKLGWDNVVITALPYPNLPTFPTRTKRHFPIVSVARDTTQKRNKKFERRIEHSGIRIVKSNASSWQEYYQFLGEAVSLLITAKEETYGYQIIDALINGCIPIAPNNYSYPELLPKECLYEEGNLESFFEVFNNIHMNLGAKWVPLMKMEGLARSFFVHTFNIMIKGRR